MEKLLAVAFLVVATTTLAQNADLTLTSDQVKKIDVTVPSDQVEKICESYNKGKESESLPISILNSIDADKVARSLWSVLQYMTKENGVRSALTFGLEDDYFSKLKYRLNDYFSRNETLAQPTLEEIVWNLYRTLLRYARRDEVAHLSHDLGLDENYLDDLANSLDDYFGPPS